MDRYDDGAPSWVELTTADLDSAAHFYGNLFGWQARAGAPGTGEGLTFLAGGQPAAAAVTGPGRPAWTTFINVADLDKTLAKVKAAGGGPGERAVRGPAGRMATVTDPAGVRFALWEAGTHPGSARTGEPGTFSWGELITDDAAASLAFYGAAFGWTLSDPAGALARREWLLNGRAVAGLLPRPPAMAAEIPPYWDVYFAVTDAAATAAAVSGLGGTVLMPPTPTGHGTIAVFTDLAGAVFTVLAAER